MAIRLADSKLDSDQKRLSERFARAKSLICSQLQRKSGCLLRIRHSVITILKASGWTLVSGSNVRVMSQEIDEVCEMFLAVTRSLVDHPEDLRIEPVSDGTAVTFSVQTHPKDIGQLIGTNGRTARALRVLLNANGVKLNLPLTLDICSADEKQFETSARQKNLTEI